MAQIRLGNGGQAVPGRAPQINTPASGMGVAEALTDMGRTVAAGALDTIAQERQRQQAQDEAVRRAQEGAALHETITKLTQLEREIGEQTLSGQLERDKAEGAFGERSKELIDESLGRFREDARPIVMPRLQAEVLEKAGNIRRAVEVRGKREVTAAIEQSLEYFERLYPTDRAKAETSVTGLLQAMGPFSDMTPEQLTKLGQGWKERTQFATAQRMVNSSIRDNKALDQAAKALDGPEFADLDTTKKGQILTTIESARLANIQRAEVEARRRDAERQRQMNIAEHYMKAAESIFVSGRPLKPEFAAEVSAGVANTPYATAFREMMAQAQEGTSFALRPLAEQQAILQQMRQDLNKGSDPRAEERYSKFVRTNAEVEKAYKADPIQAGADYGLVQLEPLPLTDLNNLGPALQMRGQQAALVAQQTGRPVSPFTAQEAEQVGTLIMTLPAADRSRYVASISAAVGPQTAGAVAQQIDKKDRALGLSFLYAGSATPEGRLTSEIVLRGSQAKKDGTSTKGEKVPDVAATKWKATAAAALMDVYPVQTMTDATVDAAELIMHGIAAENGGRLTEKDMDRAVELAIGGKLLEGRGQTVMRNGVPFRVSLPLPAGVDEDTFEKRLKTVTPDEIGAPEVLAGGVKVPASEWVKTLPGSELIYAGPGRYSVLVKGRPVTKPDGSRVVIKVTQ